jgi:hypothetical protein
MVSSGALRGTGSAAIAEKVSAKKTAAETAFRIIYSLAQTFRRLDGDSRQPQPEPAAIAHA